MDVNIGYISGFVSRIQDITSGNGNAYASMEIQLQEFTRDRGQQPVSYSFAFFHEAADTVRTTCHQGDYVMVQYRLRHNSKGYMDIMAQSAVVIKPCTAQPRTATRPMACAPGAQQPTRQTATQYSQPAPQYSQPVEDTPF